MKLLAKLPLVFNDPKTWNPDYHVDDFMWYQTVLLKCTGMCYINFEDYLPLRLAFVSNILNWLIFGIISFVHLHVAILFIFEMMHTNELAVITNAIAMVIINSFAFYTLVYFKLNYKKYMRMVNYMNAAFWNRSAYGLTFMTAERSYIVANRYTFVWIFLCLQCTLQWLVEPLFESTRTLPIKLTYPVDELV